MSIGSNYGVKALNLNPFDSIYRLLIIPKASAEYKNSLENDIEILNEKNEDNSIDDNEDPDEDIYDNTAEKESNEDDNEILESFDNSPKKTGTVKNIEESLIIVYNNGMSKKILINSINISKSRNSKGQSILKKKKLSSKTNDVMITLNQIHYNNRSKLILVSKDGQISYQNSNEIPIKKIGVGKFIKRLSFPIKLIDII